MSAQAEIHNLTCIMCKGTYQIMKPQGFAQLKPVKTRCPHCGDYITLTYNPPKRNTHV